MTSLYLKVNRIDWLDEECARFSRGLFKGRIFHIEPDKIKLLQTDYYSAGY